MFGDDGPAEEPNRAEPLAADRGGDEGFSPDRSPLFATETMAELLEVQGHSERAEAIRKALHIDGQAADEQEGVAGWSDSDAFAETWPAPGQGIAGSAPAAVFAAGPCEGHRTRTLATLERWLENVRRDVA